MTPVSMRHQLCCHAAGILGTIVATLVLYVVNVNANLDENVI